MQAGEPLGALIAEKCHGRLVLFALSETERGLQEHLSGGGWGVYGRGAQIVFRQGEVANAITAHGPLSLSRLAAIAAAWAVGLDCEQIASASL